ncbi:MAG: HEPN domain-containing protein [Ignavibacteriae bacterium]|nr:HEPN domain-containing protein [Ignavibacteriota bacterium]
MTPKESLYPADWLHIAEKDFQRVEQLLNTNDAEAAGFYLQQSVEKFLKAFLLSKGWKLERIHDLEALQYNRSLEKYRSACQKITGFYSVGRYPYLIHTSLTAQDVRDALEEVKALIETVRATLGK